MLLVLHERRITRETVAATVTDIHAAFRPAFHRLIDGPAPVSLYVPALSVHKDEGGIKEILSSLFQEEYRTFFSFL